VKTISWLGLFGFGFAFIDLRFLLSFERVKIWLQQNPKFFTPSEVSEVS
jgi:hypothetical protein